MYKVIGFLFATLVMVGAILLGPNATGFINTPALLIVFGATFGMLAFTFGADGISFLYSYNKRQIKMAKFGGYVAKTSGWLGALIGWIQIGMNMTDFSTFGPAVAVSALTIFYGYALNFFLFVPILYRKNKPSQNNDARVKVKEAV